MYFGILYWGPMGMFMSLSEFISHGVPLPTSLEKYRLMVEKDRTEAEKGFPGG